MPLARSKFRGLSLTDLMMLVMVLIWGFNYSFIKLSLREIPPFTFNVLRFSLATLLMLLILRLRGETLAIARRDWPAVILLALAGHGIYQLFFITGLSLTTAANSALLLASMPIFVAIYSHFFKIERANGLVWAGIGLSFLGIILLMLGGGKTISLSGAHLAGDLLTLVAAMLWGAYSTISKPLLVRYSPVKLTALQMTIGTPILVAVGLPGLLSQDWRPITAVAWGGAFYSAVLATVVAYVFWSIGIQRTGSARTAVYSNLTPIAAALAAWLILGDRMQPAQALGAAVVVCGLILTRRGRTR